VFSESLVSEERVIKMVEIATADHIVLIEDQELIAHALATVIERSGRTVDLICPPADADLVDLLSDLHPDLVLLDLDLGPWGDATPIITPVTAAGILVVLLTGVRDPIRLATGVEAGACGVVDKWSSFAQLLAAVDRALHQGGLLTEHERQEHLALLRAHRSAEEQRLAPFELLTNKEAEVLGELMAGRTVAQIAETSFLSVTTVRTHVRAILSKIRATSQVAAVARAHAAGWRPPQERSEAAARRSN
jgi:two-component system, NarL family, nitrate/nitrite response regulator NarL